MAILQSLVSGNRCLISDWGGHSDFKNYFPSRTTLMKVSPSLRGPTLSAQTIADAVEHALGSALSDAPIQLHRDYRFESFLPQILALMNTPYSAVGLEFSPLADSIYAQKKTTYGSSQMRIFSDYQDPLFLEISAFYIGQQSNTESYNSEKDYKPVPWIGLQRSQYKVFDPHKGELVFLSEKELFESGYLIRED